MLLVIVSSSSVFMGTQSMSELLYPCRIILSHQAGASEVCSTVNLRGLDVDLYLCVNLQGKFYLLIEELSQLFRALVPIQLWYKYIMGEDPSSSYFLGATLIIIYTLCKVAYLIVSLPLMIRFILTNYFLRAFFTPFQKGPLWSLDKFNVALHFRAFQNIFFRAHYSGNLLCVYMALN